ncbi:diaminopimelate epimerase [Comamonas piscis]|uniref:Diaminopimelate epimerase n=1 Tax=Comamonas piscis TaxID=1562974 RepID=A0A7G5EMT1_9BURK|nr:diaminopimelate epimerase [Comamonas piscis]QMV75306.1 diaminopimelate epimerase [Comamonas piscis]WSO33801.1 diaminopimelate epimerase [Comamonas piscis]
MDIRFTKMQGAGNDFVVLDETAGPLGLRADQYRFLADRHFGVGADQILTVRPSPAAGIDFEYLIHNADGGEVEQCGNGARCFARYVYDKGLTDKQAIRVQTQKGVIAPELMADGRVTVNMGQPRLVPDDVPFNTSGLTAVVQHHAQKWPLALQVPTDPSTVFIVPVSMGNPHAVMLVDDVDTAPVESQGPVLESHPRFPERVNVGFLQVQSEQQVRLRVFERGTGETLACGTGACAAVVAGIALGLLQSPVDVQTRGGLLTIAWSGEAADPVMMTGPATTVFEGQIRIPD